MKLKVPYLKEGDCLKPDELSAMLDTLPREPLTNNSWPQIPTLCHADFVIAHAGNRIMLKFMVFNDYFRSGNREINGEVHLDNCVEFFISFDGAARYYNIEFNCLGIGKMAYGKRLGARTFVNTSAVRKILTFTKFDREGERFNWEMVLSIPAEVFIFHQIDCFEGITATGNFYKCGDALPRPHYLSWNRIISPEPDFHRPDCFGELKFMPADAACTG